MNKLLLQSLMKNKGHTQESLSEVLDIDRSTFNRKLNDFRGGFSVQAAAHIQSELGMTDEQLLQVFFR